MNRFVVVASLATLSACGSPAQQDEPQQPAPVLAYDGAGLTEATARAAHGERLTKVLGCTGCHGTNLRGEVFADEPGFGTIHAPNLPLRLAGYSDAQIETALREGKRPNGSELWVMPSEMYTHLSKADSEALTAYLRTLPPGGKDTPPPTIDAGWREEIASGKFKTSPAYIAEEKGMAPFDAGAQHARARMITMTACTECHAAKLEGRDRSPNLDIVGAYSPKQFSTLMRTGKPPSGKELRLMSDVARGRFSRLTDREVAELYAYLKVRADRPQ